MPNNSRFQGSYRPPPRDNHHNRDFGNRNGPPPRDSHRPTSYSGRNDRNSDVRWSREGQSNNNMSRGQPPVDNYRPPQGNFSFRFDKPAGVQEADTYRPQNDRSTRNDRREPRSPDHDSRSAKRHRGAQDRSLRNGNGGRGNFRQDRGFGGRPWRPFIAAERELLKTDHNTGSEVAFYSTSGGVTYRPLNELSDSEEAEMDISGDEADTTEEPSAKRARVAVEQSASDNTAPKWSNPDPYTALPPETATQGKKKDVVQMIRKSRVQAATARTSLPSESADFISLDFDDSDASDHGDGQEVTVSTAATPASAASSAASAPLDKPPQKSAPSQSKKASVLKPELTSAVLGSRKRTHDDVIKMPHTKLKKATSKPAGGGVVDEWRADPGSTPTPWLEADHSGSANMAVWLHKEVVDFYDYIKPRDFEERMRHELVQELKSFCRRVFRDAEVYPFGSFPSGLYLPAADMDLAFMSDGYVAGGAPKYFSKTFLHRFRGQLVNHGVAWQDEIELILHAKVPLVKFIEHRTGLKVDVSFENDSGVAAIKTFEAWREQYPGMPALVTMIKHFLLMRGLNEPVNGGIGGFSVICLVVSMLQMMPEVQSGNLDTRHHLGQLLLHFFDLYGNKFNYQTIAISLNPPRWIPKHQVTAFPYKNHNRLSIIDPNNPENDIAGGSSNAGTVMSQFAEAHRLLTQRLVQLAQDPNRAGKSILEVIMGGNYSSFETTRNYLRALAEQRYQPPPRSSSGNQNKQSSDRSYRPNKRSSSSQRPSHARNGGNSRRRK